MLMDRNVAQALARLLLWKGWSNESPFKQQIRTRLGNWGILNNKPKKRLGNWEISNHKSGQGWEWEIGEQNKHFKLTDSNSFPSTITFSPCFFWRKFDETRISNHHICPPEEAEGGRMVWAWQQDGRRQNEQQGMEKTPAKILISIFSSSDHFHPHQPLIM